MPDKVYICDTVINNREKVVKKGKKTSKKEKPLKLTGKMDNLLKLMVKAPKPKK